MRLRQEENHASLSYIARPHPKKESEKKKSEKIISQAWWPTPGMYAFRRLSQDQKFNITIGYIVNSCQPELQETLKRNK